MKTKFQLKKNGRPVFLLTYPFSKCCNSSWRKFTLHWKRLLLCYMCTHADSRAECCHHRWYLKSKVLWTPQGQIKELHSQHALFCTILAVKLTKTPHSFPVSARTRSLFGFCLNSIKKRGEILATSKKSWQFLPPYSTSLLCRLFLLNICSRPPPLQRAWHKGSLQYYFSLFTRAHLWLMGVTGANYQLISFLHISSQCRQFACNSLFFWVCVEKSELCGT